MSDLLEFRLLKFIVAIAETANFTRASERLFLAQPTLSQQVIALEEGIGVQIFVRRREGVSLTPAGQMLYAYAQEALELRDEVVSAARAMDRGEIAETGMPLWDRQFEWIGGAVCLSGLAN